MATGTPIDKWRSWIPIPTEDRRLRLDRWILLEGNRLAVTGALLTLNFLAIVGVGTIWPFEIQRLLTETQAVQTILNTLMSGIILLVSVVVSISAIVLTYDMASVSNQEDRIEGSMAFHHKLGQLAGPDETPTDPKSFLRLMAKTIRSRVNQLEEVTDEDEEFSDDIREHVESIVRTVEQLDDSLTKAGGGEFAVLWLGLETDYASLMNQTRNLTSTHKNHLSENVEAQFNELLKSLEVFATGREYFKTLYYSREIAGLSQTLLVISLPAILFSATMILAINAGLLPEVRVLGLPPLLTFIAIAFTVALAPFIVLTSYILRVATVARRTASAGPFILSS